MRLTVTRLGHLGDGMAQDGDGRAISVPMALPGEVVEGEIIDGRMPDRRIIDPSPRRVAAPCPHYRACGGCAVQHADDAFVADWKRGIIGAALAAHGLAAEVGAPVTSPPRSRRRAVLSGRRLKNGGALVGFHGRASATITEIGACHLLHPALLATLPALRDITQVGASRKAELSLHVTTSDAGVDVLVAEGQPLDVPRRLALAGIARQHRLARLCWGDEVVAMSGSPGQKMGAARVVPPPGAFLQATAQGQAALLAVVLEIVGDAGRIADLFAGCGTFALPLSAQAMVHAVEGDGAMLAALTQGWRATTGLRGLTTETRDLFRRPLLPDELSRFDAVVIDPPRAGAEAQCREIAASGLRRLAYVSCNPASFARDAATLVRAGFAMGPVTVVDQFRWSTHVEIVAAFRRV